MEAQRCSPFPVYCRTHSHLHSHSLLPHCIPVLVLCSHIAFPWLSCVQLTTASSPYSDGGDADAASGTGDAAAMTAALRRLEMRVIALEVCCASVVVVVVLLLLLLSCWWWCYYYCRTSTTSCWRGHPRSLLVVSELHADSRPCVRAARQRD